MVSDSLERIARNSNRKIHKYCRKLVGSNGQYYVFIKLSVATETHQSDEYGEQLNDIRVRDTGETAENGVKNCDATTQDHTGSLIQFDDNAQRGSCA